LLDVENRHNNSSAVAEMGDLLATIDMDRKVGRGCMCPFPLGPHLHNVTWAEVYLRTMMVS